MITESSSSSQSGYCGIFGILGEIDVVSPSWLDISSRPTPQYQPTFQGSIPRTMWRSTSPHSSQAPGLTTYFERPTAEMRLHSNSYDALFFFYPMRLLWSSNSTLVRCENENAAPEYDCFYGLHYLHLSSIYN